MENDVAVFYRIANFYTHSLYAFQTLTLELATIMSAVSTSVKINENELKIEKWCSGEIRNVHKVHTCSEASCEAYRLCCSGGVRCDNVKVFLLPLNAAPELAAKSKYHQLFNVVYISNRSAHLLVYLQGGPAKVRPTYIFDGNIWMHR